MPESLSSILTITGLALLITLVWGATIAIVYWDTGRRGMGGGKQLLWLALAALLPLVGFVAYLWARVLAGTQPRREGTIPYPAKRTTAAKRPPKEGMHMPTIAGIDLGKPTSVMAETARSGIPLRKPSRQRFALEAAGGPHTGHRYPLNQLPQRIGRGSSSMIRLDNDLGVSRQHAEIYERDGALYVRDLQSAHFPERGAYWGTPPGARR